MSKSLPAADRQDLRAKGRRIDAHIGAQVRLRRTLLGISQTELSRRLGLTFQQIQKYEAGSNRIAASRLYQFADALDVPVSFFFDDMPPDLANKAVIADEPRPVPDRETILGTQALAQIRDSVIRQRAVALLRAIIENQAFARLENVGPTGSRTETALSARPVVTQANWEQVS